MFKIHDFMSALKLEVLPTQTGQSLPAVIDNWYRDQRLLAPQVVYKEAAIERSVAKESKEEKKQGPPAPADPVRTALLSAHKLLAMTGKMGKARGGMGKPVKVKLCFNSTVNGSAATALTVSVGLFPSSSADWSAFASLYDEVRVVGSVLHYRFYTSAVSADSMEGVVAYDPIEGTALPNLANALAYRHHSLFSIAAGPTARCAAPLPVVSHGWWSIRAKVYSDAVRNVTSTAITNGWMSTTDPTDVWGYWKFLVSPPSSAVSLTLSYLMELHVEFRSRQ